MEVNLLEIKKWNEIEKSFTDKFGWKKGLKLMITTSKEHTLNKSVCELSMAEENRLIKDLRKTYTKEAKCLEKGRVKQRES